jgi:hypothetical protein
VMPQTIDVSLPTNVLRLMDSIIIHQWDIQPRRYTTILYIVSFVSQCLLWET